jgi:hypothetical protein
MALWAHETQGNHIMNTKSLIAAAALAFAGTGAFATEATQFTDIGGQLSRAQVQAELAQAQAKGELTSASALYGYLEPAVASTRSREDVRAEARMAARDNRFEDQYVA